MKKRSLKVLKKLTAISLSGAMLLGMAACGTKGQGGESDDPNKGSKDLSWLNHASCADELPIVAEGTEKKLSIFVKMEPDSPDPESTWMYKFITEGMNIDLEVTKFTEENQSEFLSLAFASNELPDIIIGGGFTTEQLVSYGATEKQLLDLKPYITDKYMPVLSGIYAEHPEYLTAVTDSDGHIYSLGYIGNTSGNEAVGRVFLNYDWLEACNKEVPKTLDEFLDVLRAFKAMDAKNIPMGGCYEQRNPMLYILNALGYLTNDEKGLSIALRDGKVVLPVADREAYGAFLEFMKTCYDEGLIHPDFFTMSDDASTSLVTEERVGFFREAPFLWTDNYGAFWGALPLTSKYNDTAQWPINPSALSCGGAVVSATCKEPELAVAFLDYWYVFHNNRLISEGPNTTMEADYLYGVGGWTYNTETRKRIQLDMEADPEKWNNKNEYLNKNIRLWQTGKIGNSLNDGSEEVIGYTTNVYPDIDRATAWKELSRSEEANADGNWHFIRALQYTVCDYLTTDVFPGQVYLDSETTETANNLLIVIKEYAEKEMAKFITGARPLSELDQYFDEIERLGAKDYVKIYADYYESLK